MPDNIMNPYIKLMLILLIITLVFGCSDQQEKLIGTYSAVDAGAIDPVAVSLELLADGKGFLSIETDNAPFRWDLYQNGIRLHTKSGVIIEGAIDHDTIQFILPVMGLNRFQRIR